ncbi:MAG: formylglycine-generating enzyme family protein [Kiritimatiellae bacterium]|nr:formylglycine-generating enzyme family protein [Kiritimatiellia bacterium]
MKTRKLVVASALAAAFVASAVVPTPTVSDVVLSADEATGGVAISYNVDVESVAIVSLEVKNASGAWVPIPADAQTFFIGETNCRVGPGTHRAVYRPGGVVAGRRALDANNFRAKVKAWSKDAPPDYMVADLTMPSNVLFYASKEDVPLGVTNDLYKTQKLVMRKIPAGGVSWRMGTPSGSTGISWDSTREKARQISFTNDYYIGIYPVTQAQYWNMAGSKNGCTIEGLLFPCTNCGVERLRGSRTGDGIDWPATGHRVADSSVLGRLRKFTGQDFDLPTEAQWEYATRGGIGGFFSNNGPDTKEEKCKICWCASNCTNEEGVATCWPVGLKEPNNWGIYDMQGHFYELCQDWWLEESSSVTVGIDPTGPTYDQRQPNVTARVVRGGTYGSRWDFARSADRSNTGPGADGGASNAHRLWCSAYLK